MTNVTYTFSNDGQTAYGRLPDGHGFIVDTSQLHKIADCKFYVSYRDSARSDQYIVDCKGKAVHRYLMEDRKGYEIDHINLDTFDNRLCNLRYCTHQQNQINQPLQKNNTSGVSGVSWYGPRNKYRARIKIGQHDIHLGYYKTFTEAVQARNVGMECMFGEYGRYNDVPPAPECIKKIVIDKCKRFAELSVCKAFLVADEAA